ncbi:MAG: hypothetical protein AMJ81_05010 [Phycisphaerae bacterium SM23_33]|jgi:hypothetical protein|nr:MAG: hypothetical protein AMJ81_05010 [Phycisphaerae bacterium SM23_33]
MIGTLFVNPIEMGRDHIWLVLPLCAVVALVYKTVRVARLKDLPLQVLGLWAYMLAGLIILGVVLYLLV